MDPFYRRQCWEIIYCFLVASLNFNNDENRVQQLFSCPSFDDPHVEISAVHGIPYRLQDKQARATHQTAVTGVFVAAAMKELRRCSLFVTTQWWRYHRKLANLKGMD